MAGARQHHAASPTRQQPPRRANRSRTPGRGESPVHNPPPANDDSNQRRGAQGRLETVPETGPVMAQSIETGAPSARADTNPEAQDARLPKATGADAPQEPVEHNYKPAQRPRLRQATPDQEQLQRDLRQASEEAQEPQPQQSQPEPQLQSAQESQLAPHTQPPLPPVPTLQRWQEPQVSSSSLPIPSTPQEGPSSSSLETVRTWLLERDIPARLLNQLAPFLTDYPQQQPEAQAQHDIPGETPNESSDDSAPIHNVVDNIPVLRPFTRDSGPQLEISKKDLPAIARVTKRQGKRRNIVLILITSILSFMTAFGALYMVSESFRGVTSRMHLPYSVCSGTQSCAPYVADAFNKLSSSVDRKLADLASEVASVKEEVQQKVANSPAQSNNPLSPLRVNFLAPSMGAVVDPYLTSPTTLAAPISFFGRVAKRMAGMDHKGMTPVAALQPWQELGECWCSPGSSPQLAVQLGYQIIPEEVIIEHIQPGATLDPTVAPRHMELWAEYSPIPPKEGDSSSTNTGRPKSTSPVTKRYPRPRNRQTYIPSLPVPPSELEYLLSTLRMAYPGEPDTNFSRNDNLGLSFFRLGKWQYDVHGEQNIQRFKLDAVIDLPGYRISKVIVRATSNWGGKHTCFYRVRLHGRS